MRSHSPKTAEILCLFSLMLALVSLTNCAKNEGAAAADYATDSLSLSRGAVAFGQYCVSCHAIEADGIGPRLGGITRLLSEEALSAFIQQPAAAIEAGDPRATMLLAKYKQLMPAFSFLAATEVRDILSYVHQESMRLGLEPLVIEGTVSGPATRLAPPVQRSGLTIELEEYLRIPRSADRPPDKGIATLRAHPSGDGTLFVSDQVGVIYRIQDLVVDTFLDLRSQTPHFIDAPGIGTGLGSFVFHPGFLANGLLYTTHAEAYTGKSAINDGAFPDTLGVGLQWVLTEWKTAVPGAKRFAGTRREVLRLNTPTTAHGVQDIGFAPGLAPQDPNYGMLYLGIGDGGSNNIKRPELCHNLQSLLGTVIRIDPTGNNSATGTYGIPPDNPFVAEENPLTRREIWAYGFRNPHRMCWTGATLLVADIGEANVEEINVVQRGGDYGWSAMEGNYGISTKEDLKTVYPLSASERARYRGPFAQYDHYDGNAISGGFVYEGELAALKGHYFFGDIVTGKLFSLPIDPTLENPTVNEVLLVREGQETSVRQLIPAKRAHMRIGYDPFAGQLYVMTKGDGMIRRVAKAYVAQNEVP